MRRLLTGIAVMGLAVLLATGASAGQISYTDCITLSSTNWADCMTIPKFDSSLGTLTSIQIELLGYVEGTAKFESKDDCATTVTMELKAEITLKKPGGADIVQVIPLASTSDCATAWDGVDDFGGTSGKTYTDLSGTDCDTSTLTLPADLALFIGTGNIELPVTADGASTGSGAGNLLLQFATSAEAGVRVTYFYEIPEPATLTLLGTGLVGALGVFRRRRMK